VPRTGYVQPNIANRFTIFGRPGARFERYTAFVTVNGVWRYDDFFAGRSVLEDRLSFSNQLTFRGGWSVNANPVIASYAFDPARYRGLRSPGVAGTPPADDPGAPLPFVPSARTPALVTSFSVATPQFRRLSASAGGSIGHDVDFLETSRVRRRDYNASLTLRPSERLRVNATYVSTSFVRRSTGEQTLSTRIPRLKAEYQIARPAFVRIVSQYESSRRAPLRDPRTGAVLLVESGAGVFAPSAARSANALRTDWLFSYRPSPGAVFFAGYGNTLTEPGSLAFAELRRVNDAFFVKLSYVFRMRRAG
jgi:hypothetical protein